MRNLKPLITEALRESWRDYHACQEVFYSTPRFRGGETAFGLARQLGIRGLGLERLRLQLTLVSMEREGLLERFVTYDSTGTTGTVWRLCEAMRRATVPIGTERPYRRLSSFGLNRHRATIDYS